MEWRSAESNQWIIDMGERTVDHTIILSWQWPKDIQLVYIAKLIDDQDASFVEEKTLPMKLYTREEYKANAGYKDIIRSIGKVVYKIYPAIRENGQMIVLDQKNQDNELVINAEKIKIHYSIRYKQRLFSQQKTVQMMVRSETGVPKETLCYVKKEGNIPTNIDEGLIYSFVDDFDPGRTSLPEIQVNKTDFIRLFFTDGKKYGDLYELIPE